MNFSDLQSELVKILRTKIRNGEISERRMAVEVGLSQPHIHNIMKGLRQISPSVADRLMSRYQIRLETSIHQNNSELNKISHIYLTSSRIGEGSVTWHPERIMGTFSVPFAFLGGPGQYIAARLGLDDAMAPFFLHDDIVVIDYAPCTHIDFPADSVFVVQTVRGVRLRHLKATGGQIWAAGSASRSEAGGWVALGPAVFPLECIAGRVIWLSRQIANPIPASSASAASDVRPSPRSSAFSRRPKQSCA